MATEWHSACSIAGGTPLYVHANYQAKRRRSDKMDDKELSYATGGQIFCEMLGQTCYKEFYENDEMKYQEVLISSHFIHIKRPKFSLLTICRHS